MAGRTQLDEELDHLYVYLRLLTLVPTLLPTPHPPPPPLTHAEFGSRSLLAPSS